MSNTTPRRGPATSTASGASGRRAPATGPSASPTPGAHGASPSNVLTSNGTAGTSAKHSTPTGRPARPTSRRPVGSTSSSYNAEDETKAEEARAESAALIESLRQSLKEAESSSEDYKRQLAAAHSKVDDLMTEQSQLEEQYQQSSDRVQELEFEQRESKRHAQEMERIYDGERNSMMRDREEAGSRENDLKATIQRLKESIAEREFRAGAGGLDNEAADAAPKTGDEAEPQFAPSSEARTDSQGSRVLVQKDQIIESLRLELADAQIKLIEMENAGGDRVQDLEKTLLETRMANARLQEDNESFQLLLGERTISGDFQKTELMQGAGGSSMTPSGLGSLAEELESAEGESVQSRRLEAELKALKEQNKALTLYIEKIISRVLQHDNFETILDQKGGLGAMPGASGGRDKELPPPPPAKDEKPGDGFLQRATSVVRRQRPVSAMFTSTAAPSFDDGPTLTARHPRPSSSEQQHMAFRQPTANENPATAPSIPLGRSVSQRGARPNNRLSSVSAASGGGSGSLSSSTGGPPSAGGPPTSGGTLPSSPEAQRTPEVQRSPEGVRSSEMPGAAGIVNQMYRGPQGSNSPPGQPLSPLLSPGGTRSAYFGGALSGSPSAKPRQSSESTVSGTNLGSGTTAATARPPSAGAGAATHPDDAHLSPPPSSSGGTRSASASMTGSVTPTTSAGGADAAGDASSTGATGGPASPPRDRAGNTQYTGAVMQQNRLRPLRLVQESSGSGGEDAAAAARKKANRGSWMGWFNRGTTEGMPGGAGGLPDVGE